jgi:DNA-binding NarL/FixJ family response regulator
MATRRILIADDHAAVRRSLRSILETHPELELSGEATNGREAVELARRLKPDVVLMDMTMPELSGLEATREILKDAPDTQVLLLTVHESEELTEEALRAGAQGIVLKSAADEILRCVIESDSTAAVHLAGRVVGRARHIGAFIQSKLELSRLLGPFVAEGLSRGEKAVHIINPSSRELHERQLSEAGVDVDAATSQDRMELYSWDDMYLKDGVFDKEAMVTRIERLLHDRVEHGFARARLVADMEWALEDRRGVEGLAEYEAQINHVLPKHDDLVLCVYDLTKFPADLIIDVLRSHPTVVVAGSLYTNPFFTPPDQMVDELRQRHL